MRDRLNRIVAAVCVNSIFLLLLGMLVPLSWLATKINGRRA